MFNKKLISCLLVGLSLVVSCKKGGDSQNTEPVNTHQATTPPEPKKDDFVMQSDYTEFPSNYYDQGLSYLSQNIAIYFVKDQTLFGKIVNNGPTFSEPASTFLSVNLFDIDGVNSREKRVCALNLYSNEEIASVIVDFKQHDKLIIESVSHTTRYGEHGLDMTTTKLELAPFSNYSRVVLDCQHSFDEMYGEKPVEIKIGEFKNFMKYVITFAAKK